MKPIWQMSNHELEMKIRWYERDIDKAERYPRYKTPVQYSVDVERLEGLYQELAIRQSENVTRFYKRA